MNELGVNGKLVAVDARAQPRCQPKLLHAITDRKQPSSRQPARENTLGDVIGAQTEHGLKPGTVKC